MKKPRTKNATTTTPESLQWAQYYLTDFFTDQPSQFHHELMNDLQDANHRLIARVAPRGHAKSTCAAFAFPLWCICQKHRKNIVIITHESSLARQFVRDIRHELETNEKLIAKYGDLCNHEQENTTPKNKTRKKNVKRRKSRSKTKWTQDKFTTNTGITVQAKGTGASFRGTKVGPHRPDLIICDDIEKDEHVESLDGRRKLDHWLRRVVMPALDPDGQLLLLGSIIHYDSLLANLRDRRRFPKWNYRVYRALEGHQNPDGSLEIKSLWPSRWSVDRLKLERERVGTLAFEQEYQANPIDDTIRVFRPEWLQRYEPTELTLRKQHLVPLMTIDPATGTTGGDYFALWTGAVDRQTGIIYSYQLQLDRIGIVQQIQRIIAAFEEFRPVKIGIETVAYQVALKQILEEESRNRRLYMPLVPIQTIANKRARIEGTAPFYENGTFRLPPVIDHEVESQFLQFPKSRHDDAPDVCAMAIELARNLRCIQPIEGFTARGTPTAAQW